MAEKRVIEQTASTELYNDDWFLKDSVVEGTTKISAAKLKELLGADGTQALEEIANAIAEEYDSTHTYSLNDWVFHEGTLYRCIGNNVTGTWNATKWQAKTIKQFISDSENLITGRLLQMFGEYMPFSTLDPPSIEAISKGDIFIYQRTNRYKFYRAKADHPQGVTEFDIDDWDEFDTVSDLIENVTEKIAEIEIPVKDVQVKTDSTYDSVVDASGNAKIDLSSVTAYGEVPNLPQAIATFKDGADAPMKSLKVGIEPQQDLHGYDSPWVGGAGKNKLPLIISDIKSLNTSGTWNGNTYTINNVAFTIQTDGGGNVIGIATNGIANSEARIVVCDKTLNLGSSEYYTLSGCPSGGGDSTYNVGCWRTGSGSITEIGNGQTFSYSEPIRFVISVNIKNGTNSANKLFQPMIESGSTKTSFAPYSNICPISGWDEANVTRTGKNLFDKDTVTFTEGFITSTGEISTTIPSYEHTSYIKVNPNTNYVFSGDIIGANLVNAVAFYNSKKEFISRFAPAANTPASFTTPNNCVYISTNVYNIKQVNTIQLEEGTTATSYEAFGTTYTIDLDGTRYGGTLDVVSGVLTVDRVIKFVSECTWYGSNGVFYTDKAISTIKKGDGRYDHCISDAYKTVNKAKSDQLSDGELSVDVSGYIQLKDLRYSSSSDLKTAMGNTQLVYELATPLTIQLTPTAVKSLLGRNNVRADTGDINECVYRRDMTSTIDDIIARLEALEG